MNTCDILTALVSISLINVTEQLTLFESTTPHRVQQPQQPLMSKDALIKWKTKIFDYQQKAVTQQSPQQISLFDTAPTHCDVDTINPFELKLHSSQFYRMREQGDHEVPGFA